MTNYKTVSDLVWYPVAPSGTDPCFMSRERQFEFIASNDLEYIFVRLRSKRRQFVESSTQYCDLRLCSSKSCLDDGDEVVWNICDLVRRGIDCALTKCETRIHTIFEGISETQQRVRKDSCVSEEFLPAFRQVRTLTKAYRCAVGAHIGRRTRPLLCARPVRFAPPVATPAEILRLRKLVRRAALALSRRDW